MSVRWIWPVFQPAPRPVRWKRRGRRAALFRAARIALGGALLAVVSIQAPRWLNAALQHPFFAVPRFHVEGNQRLSEQAVLDWIGAKPGMSIWWVDAVAWRSRLLAHPWVQSAEVRRQLPREVRIRLRERWPVAVVRLGGTFQYVDRTGHFLGGVDLRHFPELPVITLPRSEEEDYVSSDLRMALRFVRLCERVRCLAEISEVVADDRGITVYPLRSGTAVVFGRGQWKEKLKRSSRVFAAWEGQTDRLERIDLSYSNIVVVRVRPEGGSSSKGRTGRRGERGRNSV